MTAKRRTEMTRRAFVGAGLSCAAAAGRAAGANDRVGVALFGYGLRGKRLVLDFKEQPDVDVVAAVDVYAPRVREALGLLGGGAAGYADFRRALERADVDAVIVATPDQWHALQSMMACAAGKDVYVEKPLTRFVREGRWMIEAARRHRRVVQVGTQQRSGPHYRKARAFVREGGLGTIVAAHVDFHRNIMPGLGNPPDREPPPDLDWEMFTGPSPLRPYNPNRGIYHFRWFWDYAGGQMTNWGPHSVDIACWYLNAAGPRAVYSTGGRRFLRDNCDCPDVQETIFEFGDWTMTVSIRECSKGRVPEALGFFGTNGALYIDRRGYTVVPDPKLPPSNVMPGVVEGEHPTGGPEHIFGAGPRRLRTERVRDATGREREQVNLHVRNFLDCVKSREQPISDLESGHRVTTACHLANISLRVGRRVRWDADTEQIPDDDEAAAMLVRPYRAPWDAELASVRGTP